MSKRGNENPYLTSNKKRKTSKKPQKSSVQSQAPPLDLVVVDEIPARYREISIPPLKVNDYQRFYGVDGFWDFENAGLPSGCSASTLRNKIESALKAFHPKLFLANVIGFGDVRKFKPTDYEIFRTQFNITKIIPRETFCKKCSPTFTGPIQRGTDMADALLIQGMLIYGYDLQPPGNILVISGDQDFATSISAFRDRGFTMFLAHLGNSNEKLLNSATVNWLWSKMACGEGPGTKD